MSSSNAVNRISADDYIPKRFGLKYSPPVIILEYLVPSTGKLFHHKMKLDFLLKDSDTSQAVKAIQLKHAVFFEKDKITQDQIAKLVNKMKATLKSGVPHIPHRSKEKEILQNQQYSTFQNAEPKVPQTQVLNGNYMPNYSAKQAWPSPIQKHLPHDEEDAFSIEKPQKGTISQFNTNTLVQRNQTSNPSSNSYKPKEITPSYGSSSSNKENTNVIKNINNNAAASSQASRNSNSTTTSYTSQVQQQQKPSVAPSKPAPTTPMVDESIEEEFKPFDYSDDDDSETEKNIQLPAKPVETNKFTATTKAVSNNLNNKPSAVQTQASPKNEVLSKVKSPRTTTTTGSYAQKKQKSFGFEDISEDESKDEEEEDEKTNPAAKQTTEEYDEDFEHYEEEFESSVEKPNNTKQQQNNIHSLHKIADIDYHNTDLNKMTDEELKKHKAQMDINFNKNQKKPGDEGFVYDKRETFLANQSNEWDEEL